MSENRGKCHFCGLVEGLKGLEAKSKGLHYPLKPRSFRPYRSSGPYTFCHSECYQRNVADVALEAKSNE